MIIQTIASSCEAANIIYKGGFTIREDINSLADGLDYLFLSPPRWEEGGHWN